MKFPMGSSAPTNASAEVSAISSIVFHLNKFKEEFIKMKNYNRNQVLIPGGMFYNTR
jgi:hypothetical protein